MATPYSKRIADAAKRRYRVLTNETIRVHGQGCGVRGLRRPYQFSQSHRIMKYCIVRNGPNHVLEHAMSEIRFK